jgi:hypothetical protein
MIVALNPTEIAYAAEEACGPPYRLKPIIADAPKAEATPQALAGLWRQFIRSWQPAGML